MSSNTHRKRLEQEVAGLNSQRIIGGQNILNPLKKFLYLTGQNVVYISSYK